MKYTLGGLLCWCCMVCSSSWAQNRLNTPLEILTFMEASGTKYQVEQLFGKTPERPRTVLPHGAFIENYNGKEYTREYQYGLSCEAEHSIREAKELLSIEKPAYAKARKLYQKALQSQPNNAQLHTLIGETWYKEKNYTEARSSFERALSLNAIDYLARWLMAEIYLAEGKQDSALYNITTAHLYNRNQPRLLLRLKEMYNQCGKSYVQSWGFEPQYRLYKEDSVVIIAANGIWLTYAMYKAVWEYEPDYMFIKSQQSVSDYLFHQEMEAMVGTYMTYSNLADSDKRTYPSIRAFEKALDAELVEEYIMYEILLVERPTLAQYLTDTFLQRLVRYIQTVRQTAY